MTPLITKDLNHRHDSSSTPESLKQTQHIHRSLSLTALIATIISPKGETDHASYLISRQVVSLVQEIANLQTINAEDLLPIQGMTHCIASRIIALFELINQINKLDNCSYFANDDISHILSMIRKHWNMSIPTIYAIQLHQPQQFITLILNERFSSMIPYQKWARRLLIEGAMNGTLESPWFIISLRTDEAPTSDEIAAINQCQQIFTWLEIPICQFVIGGHLWYESILPSSKIVEGS